MFCGIDFLIEIILIQRSTQESVNHIIVSCIIYKRRRRDEMMNHE